MKVFPYNSDITLIQSLNLVYRIFNFDMYSFVINLAIDVNRAVLLEIIIPARGLIKLIAELPIADPDPIKISVININTFFLFKLFYFFLKYSLSILSEFNIFS